MPTPGSSGLRDLRESRSRGGLPSLLRSRVSLWLSLALLAAGGLGDTYKNLFRTRVYYSPPAQTGAPLAGKEETPEAVGEAVGHTGTTITYWRLCH